MMIYGDVVYIFLRLKSRNILTVVFIDLIYRYISFKNLFNIIYTNFKVYVLLVNYFELDNVTLSDAEANIRRKLEKVKL